MIFVQRRRSENTEIGIPTWNFSVCAPPIRIYNVIRVILVSNHGQRIVCQNYTRLLGHFGCLELQVISCLNTSKGCSVIAKFSCKTIVGVAACSGSLKDDSCGVSGI